MGWSLLCQFTYCIFIDMIQLAGRCERCKVSVSVYARMLMDVGLCLYVRKNVPQIAVVTGVCSGRQVYTHTS